VSSPPDTERRTGDIVAAWLLYALQLGFELLLTMVAALSVMATDPCGTGVDEPRVCGGYYFATAFYGYGLVLLLAAIATPVMILVARRRGRRRWPWPLAAIGALLVLTVVYFVVLSQ
jgi:hypothetical protein